ncbi:MAG: helix-turn-helix domain-containing protein [Candidatus Corynebacterium faecigallinarum]
MSTEQRYVHHLTAGDCVLIPTGVPHQLDVAANSLVVPVSIPDSALTSPATPPTVHRLDESWNGWILHHFVSTFTFLFSLSEQPQDVVRHLGVDTDGLPTETGHPKLPRSPQLRAISAELLKDPAANLTSSEWAARFGLTPRTLHRRFLDETGMSLVQWRLHCRLLAAEDFLRSGYGVEWVAHKVGFHHAGGLIRAFRKHHGLTPSSWAQRQDPTTTISARVRHTKEREALVSALHTPDKHAPNIPGALARSSDHPENLTHHVLLYIHTGTAHLELDGDARTLHLNAGDAVWGPAGTGRVVTVDPGSVVLPLRFHITEVPDPIREITTVKVPPSLREMMLHHAVWNLSLIRPDKYDRLSVLEIFDDAHERRRRTTVTMPAEPSARAVAVALTRNLRDDRTLQQWADDTGGDPRTINLGFIEDTGKTFRSWRATLRLRAAHDLMVAGTSPSAAAKRVGYKHLSGFSRDFSRHYGMTPREFVGV